MQDHTVLSNNANFTLKKMAYIVYCFHSITLINEAMPYNISDDSLNLTRDCWLESL